MTATTASRKNVYQGGPPAPTRLDLPVKANTKYYFGTLIARDADGRAVNPTDGDGLRVVGACAMDLDNSTGSESGGTDDVRDLPLDLGVAGPFAATGSPTLRPGDAAFSVDNQTVSADSDSGARGFAGRVISNRAGKVWLWVGPHVQVSDTEADVAAVAADLVVTDGIAKTGSVSVPMPATAFANGATNGFDPTVFGFRFNDTIDNQFWYGVVMLPEDLDDAADVVVKVNGYIIDDAVDDDVTWSVAARFDGGADTAPTGGAVLGEAAAVQEFTIDAADVPAGPTALFIALRASNALDTSDAVALGIEVSYTKKDIS